MSRKKKDIEEPEVMIEPVDEGPPKATEEQIQAITDSVPEPPVYEIPEVKIPPRSPYEIAMTIREDIKTTMSKAPKRNDATTMPAIVNLRCKTGDFHFTMPQFDAITVEKLWSKYKNDVTPEEFVSYLYTTMGLNPPKLYMFMNIINIS